MMNLCQKFRWSRVVYHRGSETYMVPQNDPYTLENFQEAYNRLVRNVSSQAISRSQKLELDGIHNLSLTHYALRIFPKNEKEQWEVERMEEIKVAYIPFNYVQLSEEETEQIVSMATRSEIPSYPEENPYKVVYDNAETLDGPRKTETFALPVLYVVWPCDKPLPEELDYKIDYEVFLPAYFEAATRNADGPSREALQILENEAICIALGLSAESRTETGSDGARPRVGRVYHHDNFINSDIPLHNLKIEIKLGSNIWSTYTQSNGFFRINESIPDEATFGYVFYHTKWKITRENTTTPITVTGANLRFWWGDLPEAYFRLGSTSSHFEIHRAANFYFNGSHSVRTWLYDSGIRIRSMFAANDATKADFTYSKNAPAYITVYNNDPDNMNYKIGTVLHELGHFTHYGERGAYTGSAYDGLKAVQSLLRESFASYVGFYLGELYYTSIHNYNKPYVDFNITNQGHQKWAKTYSREYSPLFVDLIDDFDQSVNGEGFNVDRIKNFPHSIIRTIAAECETWGQMKTKLQQYIGKYYTSSDFDSFVAPYDYWTQYN